MEETTVKCPKCGGRVGCEIEYCDGERIEDVKCYHCGKRFYPESPKMEHHCPARERRTYPRKQDRQVRQQSQVMPSTSPGIDHGI